MDYQGFNFSGYRIADARTHNVVPNASASFLYRGYEIEFSTDLTQPSKVTVYRYGASVGEYATVDAALSAVDAGAGWHGVARPAPGRGRAQRSH